MKHTGQGALTEAVFYILLSLYTPRHGYAVMQKIGEMSNGRVHLGAGTLYGAINTLVEKQWIKSVGDGKNSRKKEYAITDLGKRTVEQELVRLEELSANGTKAVKGELG